MPEKKVRIWIGTSGWNYPHWKDGVFYPKGLAQARWLDFYADRFDTVELNNSFYRLPAPETFRGWREKVEGEFVFAVKASRFLTHIKRLKDPREPVDRFLRHARNLRERFGPILFQLPPRMPRDLGRLERFLKLHEAKQRKNTRWTIEFRDPSWFDDEVYRRLERSNVALCLADGGYPITGVATADFVYIRRHYGQGKGGNYTRTELDADVREIRRWARQGFDVYCYYNNDMEGHAVRNALYLRDQLSDLLH